MIPRTQTELAGADRSGPSVVAIGGGAGLAATLEAVQGYAGPIAAVVTVADDGGSSGRLAPALGIPPPGDVRKALLALAQEPTLWFELFDYRFDRSDVAGHSLGNLILAALSDFTGEFTSALRLAEELLCCAGSVHPAAVSPARLCAMIGGTEVTGQVSVATTPGGIGEIRLEPADLTANPAAVAAIREADQIILAAGSLFTSLISTLLVPGIARAVDESPGSLVAVLNLVTQRHETTGLTGADHVNALRRFGGVTRTGTIVAHRGPLEVPDGVEAVSLDADEVAGWQVVAAPVVDRHASWPRHDPLALGRVLAGLATT